MNEEASRFEAEVSIVLNSLQGQEIGTKKKILYKFVLDGNSWVTDPNQELDRDFAGNLNNVIMVDMLSRNSSNSSSSISLVQTPEEVKAPKTTKVEEEESEEEHLIRRRRVKHEDDDAVIRELGGGGMWGAPVFDINNPVDLPEHFATSPEQNEITANVDDTTAAADEPAATHAVTEPSIKGEDHQQQGQDDENDKTIKELSSGMGMWGTPYFQINDSTEALTAAATDADKTTVKDSNAAASEETASIHDGCSTYSGIRESVTQIIDIVRSVERPDAMPVVDESVEPLQSLTNSRTNSALTATDSSSVSSVGSGNAHLEETDIVGFESEKDEDKDDSSVVLLPTSPLVPQEQQTERKASTLTISIPEKMDGVSTAPNTPVTKAPSSPAKPKRWSMSSATASLAASGRGSPSRSSSSSTGGSQQSDTIGKRKTLWKKVKKALT